MALPESIRRLSAVVRSFFSPRVPWSDQAQLVQVLVQENLGRLRVFGWFIILFSLALIAIDLRVLTASEPLPFQAARGLLVLRGILLAGTCFFLLLNRGTRPSSGPSPGPARSKVMEIGFLIFFFAMTPLFNTTTHPVTAGIFPFILALLFTAAFIFQPAWRSILFFGFSFCLLVLVTFLSEPDRSQAGIDLTNAGLMTLGAWLISQMVFKARVRQFLGDRLVEEQKSQLERANRRLAESNEMLRRLSMLDPLTGIANRRFFDDYLAQEWKRAGRQGQGLALIMADLDHFKNYNDGYGHQSGDRCLIQVSTVLRGSLQRAGDLAARYGGEEFVVILPDSGLEGAKRVAERMRLGVEALNLDHAFSPHGRVTISLGLAAASPSFFGQAEDLVKAADRALYRAKSEGRNLVRWIENPDGQEAG